MKDHQLFLNNHNESMQHQNKHAIQKQHIPKAQK